MVIDELPASNLWLFTCASSAEKSVPANCTFRLSFLATAVSRSLSKPVNFPFLRYTLGGASVSVAVRSVPGVSRWYGLPDELAPLDPPPQPATTASRAAAVAARVVRASRERTRTGVPLRTSTQQLPSQSID